jgi:hypothetical protein
MNRDSIETLLDELTTGISDDPELQLDIRAELASHLEDAMAAYSEQGLSDEESLARALEDFGDSDDVAAGLQEANQGRVGSRTIIRLILKRILVPAAIVVALFGVWHFAGRLNRLAVSLENIQSTYPILPDQKKISAPRLSLLPYSDPISRLSSDDTFIFYGDQSRQTRADRMRAIWEAHPDNPIYHANYISELMNESSRNREYVLQELHDGVANFPDNARYYYLEAALLLQQHDAASSTSIRDEAHRSRRAVALYKQGLQQSLYQRYSLEMLMNRLSRLGPVRYLEDQVERFRVVDMVPDRDASYLQFLLVAMADQAAALYEQGDTDQARELLQGWQTLIFQFSHDAVSIADIQSIQSLAATVHKTYVPLIREIDGEALADKAAHEADMIQNLIFDNNTEYSADLQQFSQKMLDGASLYSKVTAPIINKFPYPGVLENYRLAEHVIVEQCAVLLVIIMALLLILRSAVIGIRWRRAFKSGKPGLLLLSRRRFVQLLGVGLLLPLGLMAYYTRATSLAGREYGFSAIPERFLMELIFFAVLVLSLCSWLSERMIRERCQQLRLSVPRRSFQIAYFLLWTTMLLLWSTGAGLVGQGMHALGFLVNGGVILLGAILLVSIGRFAWELLVPQRLGAYYGAVARTLAPVYGGIILVFGLVLLPFLERQELEYLSHERQYAEFHKGGFSNMEYAHVKELRDRLDKLKQENATRPLID